jgi:hypothetical protein
VTSDRGEVGSRHLTRIDPLRLLAAWSAAHGGIDPGSHLREAGVPIRYWSRIGD